MIYMFLKNSQSTNSASNDNSFKITKNLKIDKLIKSAGWRVTTRGGECEAVQAKSEKSMCGLYYCVADNPLGRAVSSAFLTVAG